MQQGWQVVFHPRDGGGSCKVKLSNLARATADDRANGCHVDAEEIDALERLRGTLVSWFGAGSEMTSAHRYLGIDRRGEGHHRGSSGRPHSAGVGCGRVEDRGVYLFLHAHAHVHVHAVSLLAVSRQFSRRPSCHLSIFPLSSLSLLA